MYIIITLHSLAGRCSWFPYLDKSDSVYNECCDAIIKGFKGLCVLMFRSGTAVWRPSQSLYCAQAQQLALKFNTSIKVANQSPAQTCPIHLTHGFKKLIGQLNTNFICLCCQSKPSAVPVVRTYSILHSPNTSRETKREMLLSCPFCFYFWLFTWYSIYGTYCDSNRIPDK